MTGLVAGIGFKALFGSVLSGVSSFFVRLWTWLGTLNVYQLGCIGLGLYGAFATLSWKAEQRHADKVGVQLSKCVAARKSDQAAYAKAQDEAAAIALKQKEDVETHYAALASQKDREYESALASARDATDRYIATHGVRQPSNQGGSGTTTATADNHGSGIPQGLPAQTVMVSADDVQACSAAVNYAIAAHDWALGLEKKP